MAIETDSVFWWAQEMRRMGGRAKFSQYLIDHGADDGSATEITRLNLRAAETNQRTAELKLAMAKGQVGEKAPQWVRSGDEFRSTDLPEREEWLDAWGEFGTPAIRPVGSSYSAWLVATTVPGEITEALLPPWNKFVISLPDDLGLKKDGKALRALFVDWSDDRVSYWLAEGWGYLDEIKLWRICRTGELSEDLVLSPRDKRRGEDSRVLRCAGRLIAALVIEIDRRGGGHRLTTARGHRLARRSSTTPTSCTYVMRRSVEIKLCAWVREYIQKGHTCPAVQSLVRGHWKNQPHGPGATERKFIHIDPYWRGPEDAPIAVRSHILKGNKSGRDGDGTPNAAE